jgi:hypothetical protein
VGPYTYRGRSRPLGFQSRDIGLFQETDGTGYLLTEDRASGLSQTADIIPVGTGQFVYAGDRWTTGNLGTSPLIWLPLTVSGTTMALGCTGGTGRQWALTSTGASNYQLVNLATGQVADVVSGATTTGAEVEQWANNGGGNQKWSFTAG